jgi:alpha-mannosidase
MMIARGNPYTFTAFDAEADGVDVQYEDEGDTEFEYRLIPHGESWREAGTYGAALDLNRPAVAVLESAHSGDRPPVASCVSISHPNIVLAALKPVEDGRCLAARLVEMHGELTEGVRIECMGSSITADFRPTEIKTFLLPLEGGDAKETDLLER